MTAKVLGAVAAIVFISHAPFVGLPYFWDELGQFVPSALDILHDGAWVPHSAVPNVHPPGVMAYLALVWRIFGYSIPATRLAMLGVAACAAVATFFLAKELCAPAFLAVIFLLADPLFYAQAMMAQLDMPAMLFTVLALLLFLKERHLWAAAACVALVLTKETGLLAPLLFGLVLMRERRWRTALLYGASAVALAVWLWVLWRGTGQLFGDAGFTHYNIAYPLNPVRIATSLARRFYYLFIGDFRWIGAVVLIVAWKRFGACWDRRWHVAALLGVGHVLLVSLLGGATLERYLLPALPLLYIAIATAVWRFSPRWRTAGALTLAGGLVVSLFVNPPFPFPFENNLAMTDFVELHSSAARFIEKTFPDKTVYTAWPLTAALRRPEFGYVRRSMATVETSDLHLSTLSHLDASKVGVLVLYSRTWEPDWGVLRLHAVQRFLGKFYDYEPQMNEAQAHAILGLTKVVHWERRGQWAEVYAKVLPVSR